MKWNSAMPTMRKVPGSIILWSYSPTKPKCILANLECTGIKGTSRNPGKNWKGLPYKECKNIFKVPWIWILLVEGKLQDCTKKWQRTPLNGFKFPWARSKPKTERITSKSNTTGGKYFSRTHTMKYPQMEQHGWTVPPQSLKKLQSTESVPCPLKPGSKWSPDQKWTLHSLNALPASISFPGTWIPSRNR